MASQNECLSCGKKFAQKEASVKCSVCGLWCHKSCSGLTNDFFNCMAAQFKATKRTYWACRACGAYAEGMNHRLREIQDQATEAIRIGQENSEEIAKLKQQLISEKERADKAVSRVEAELKEEMTRREERRKNIVVHGLQENNEREGRLRMEADKRQLDEIFTVLDVNVIAEQDVEFCRRVGEKSDSPRPLIVGFYTEWAKDTVLKYTRRLMDSDLSNISLVPDLTEQQRRAEKELPAEAERRNAEELSEDDLAKNLHWRVVGKKGQRKLLKTYDRQGTTASQARGRGAPRGGTQRGGWQGAAATARGGAAIGLLPSLGTRATWTVRHRGGGRAAATAAREVEPEPEKNKKRGRQGSNEEQQLRPRKRGTRGVGRPARNKTVQREDEIRLGEDMEEETLMSPSQGAPLTQEEEEEDELQVEDSQQL
jgi:hypothetical protein